MARKPLNASARARARRKPGTVRSASNSILTTPPSSRRRAPPGRPACSSRAGSPRGRHGPRCPRPRLRRSPCPGRCGWRRARRALGAGVPARASAGGCAGRAAPARSPSATRLPRLTTTTRSHVAATSSSTWLESNTVPPLRAWRWRRSRSALSACGSSPLAGSSSRSTSGSAISAAARLRRRRVPCEQAPTVLSAACSRFAAASASSMSAVGLARPRRGERQLVPHAAGRVEPVAVQHAPDAAGGARCAARGAREPEQDAERRRLPRPVRAEKPAHAALRHRERQAVDRSRPPVPLDQVLDDERIHCGQFGE